MTNKLSKEQIIQQIKISVITFMTMFTVFMLMAVIAMKIDIYRMEKDNPYLKEMNDDR